METYFSRNASFRLVKTDLLASRNHKLFFRLLEKYFLTNPSFQLLEKDFFFVETFYFTSQFFPTRRNRHLYEWKLFLTDRPYSCQWKLIFQLVETFSSIALGIFQEILLPDQWKHIFQSRRKSIVFYLELIFLLAENI